MDNLFIKYMSERAKKPVKSDGNVENLGPVITISRPYGCAGERIALKLTKALTELSKVQSEQYEWRFISKEILEMSAKELKLAPNLVDEKKEYRLKGVMDHLTLFFSTDFYPSDSKVMTTVAKVIHAAASQGHVVILGRAGEAITHGMKRALHIKLQAPIEWRAEQISKQQSISLTQAKEECLEEDRLRNQFRDYFVGGKSDVDFFDAAFNMKTLSDEEIVNSILQLAKSKGVVS